MRYKNNQSTTLPRLMVEDSRMSPDKQIGFLQIQATEKGIEIGRVDAREFRLVQCLFSPRNFLSAKYEPVSQTYERAFGAIRTNADTSNARLSSPESADNEMVSIVNKTLRVLEKGKVGEHVTFYSREGKIRMDIIPTYAKLSA